MLACDINSNINKHWSHKIIRYWEAIKLTVMDTVLEF